MIEQVISPIPKLKHRNTVVTLADRDEFVTKYEATNDHLADNTVTELNTFATQVNEVSKQVNTDSQEVNKATEETRLIKSQVEQIKKDTSQIKDETSEIKTEVEQIAGAIPEGTINDTTITKTSVWSSEKVSEQLKNAGGEVAFITHSFTANEELTIPLSRIVNGAIVGVQKEVPQTSSSGDSWLVNIEDFEGELIDSIDISKSLYSNLSYNTSSQDTAMTSVAFSEDGFKMFTLGNQNDSIYEYNLTIAFNISSASYSSKSFSIAEQTTTPYSMIFIENGNKILIGGSNRMIFEYTLTVPYDISTASYSDISFNTEEQTIPIGITFNRSGLNMYIVGSGATVYQYTLTTAYDISTANYSNKNFIAFNQDTDMRKVIFSPDGYNMFLLGGKNKALFQYNLSTAYDISTANYSNKSFSLSSQATNPYGLSEFINNTFFVVDASGGIYRYLSYWRDIAIAPQNIYQTSVSKTPINTSLWAEINSFIPTQNLNEGEINYSFSKDNKESFIVSNGTVERTIAKNDSGVWKYNSNVVFEAETFLNASINDMYVSLNEAMTISQNIQSPTPFELTDNLNLAITMKSTGISPTFSNMDINYDAFSKWQEATPNTDYEAWQQGDTNNVYIKALSANNLKVRVI